MIRRWSCLINLNNNFNSWNYYFKNYKIIIFKNSVNFKKFTFKFTKFKRKSLIRLKHKSNWLIYNNVLNLWLKDYIFNKNYYKYQFYNQIFINNFSFFNSHFSKKNNNNNSLNYNFIFSSLIKKNLLFFSKINYINFRNTSINTAWFSKTPINSLEILPLYSKWNNSLFDFNNTNYLNFDITKIFYLTFSLIFKKSIEFKKILIYLMIFSNLKM